MSNILKAFQEMGQKGKDKKLSQAIDQGDASKVQEAIDNGANVNNKYIEGNSRSYVSCFAEAVAHSTPAVIDVILANNPDMKGNDKDIIEVAIYHRFPNEDCTSVVKSLIYAKADLDVVKHDSCNSKSTLLDRIEAAASADPSRDARNKFFKISKLLETYGAKNISELELSKKPQGPKKTV